MDTNRHEVLNTPSTLAQRGWVLVPTSVPDILCQKLRDSLFSTGEAGNRCLLDHPAVSEVALQLKKELILGRWLPPECVVIQAISFNKTAETNWKVRWHQDLMFPFAAPVTTEGFELPSRKESIDYARPPLTVLKEMLAVRLHLDDCDENNGPLRVCSETHSLGVLDSSTNSGVVFSKGETTILAKSGEALLMRPLLLHASSPALQPRHRRVLHLVYHSGKPIQETWHRSL